MRRPEKEIMDRAAVEEILDREIVGNLGVVDNGRPYVVPLCYGYRDGAIYFHSANEGRKLDCIRANPRVCFVVDTDSHIIPDEQACSYSFAFKSVVCEGTAEILTDEIEQQAGLNVIMEQLTGKGEWEYSESGMARATVVKITIETMTGKQSG